jgi:2,3-dihydroxy-p-cumate/2,3-dihydroxybenzoate 3,4-dioxygenase
MIRYSKLGYVELNVSDLKKSRQFYQDIVGLEYAGERSDGSVLFRCDTDHHSVVLHQNEPAGLKCVGWMLEDESQFANLHRRLRESGVPYEEIPAMECRSRNIGRATRMVEENTQATLEFYLPETGDKISPFKPSHTNIQRLGHVVFSTPRYQPGIAFFRDVLNFRISDSIGEGISFMRPFPNPYHHGMGIGNGMRPLFNHLNFMVTEVDDMGKALNRFRKHDVPIVYGPGRHPASNSIFLYYLDPDGLTLEYSFGMEEFPEDDAREARVLPLVPESIDTWGAVRDPRFGATGEMQAAKIKMAAG